jgi:hypothetical protein
MDKLYKIPSKQVKYTYRQGKKYDYPIEDSKPKNINKKTRNKNISK